MLKTKKDIKKLEANLNYIKNSLNQFTEDHFNETIKNNWTRLKEITAQETLQSMPIDTISTLEKGMPIHALTAEGLQTSRIKIPMNY